MEKILRRIAVSQLRLRYAEKALPDEPAQVHWGALFCDTFANTSDRALFKVYMRGLHRIATKEISILKIILM